MKKRLKQFNKNIPDEEVLNLSDKDITILSNNIENPSPPSERLKSAAKRYQDFKNKN